MDWDGGWTLSKHRQLQNVRILKLVPAQNIPQADLTKLPALQDPELSDLWFSQIVGERMHKLWKSVRISMTESSQAMLMLTLSVVARGQDLRCLIVAWTATLGLARYLYYIMFKQPAMPRPQAFGALKRLLSVSLCFSPQNFWRRKM